LSDACASLNHYRVGANQLAALLGPDTAAAGVDPGRPDPVVARPADDGGVAVGGQRDGVALFGGCRRVVSDGSRVSVAIK
jgi:hypothetical protein